MSEVTAQPLRPANISWRILQGVIDDLIITAITLWLAWCFGLLPSGGWLLKTGGGITSSIESLSSYLALTGQIGAILIIYATLKFIYYVAFVAWNGQTPGCYLLRLRITMVDGNKASWGDAVKRAVAGGIISHTPLIGHILRIGDYLATLFNRRKQAVRDIVAGTMLVHVTGENSVGGSSG